MSSYKNTPERAEVWDVRRDIDWECYPRCVGCLLKGLIIGDVRRDFDGGTSCAREATYYGEKVQNFSSPDKQIKRAKKLQKTKFLRSEMA